MFFIYLQKLFLFWMPEDICIYEWFLFCTGFSSYNQSHRATYSSACYNTLSSLSGISVNNSIPVSTMGCSSVLRRPCNAPTLDTSLLNSIVPSSSDGTFYISTSLFKFIYVFM